MNLYEVTSKDIELLDQRQMHDILLTLLACEARKYGIPASTVGGTLKIYAKDGGEDARIIWEAPPTRTDYLPTTSIIFQSKSISDVSTLSKDYCKKEIQNNGGTSIKPHIETHLNSGGAYILFCNQSYAGIANDDRVNALREGIAKHNLTLASSARLFLYDADKIARWATHYLPVILRIFKHIGRTLPLGFETWETLAGYKNYKNDYIFDTTMESLVAKVKNETGKPQDAFRILGYSGLGKTRAVMEAFRKPEIITENEADFIRYKNFIYKDIGHDDERIVEEVKQLRDLRVEGSLVIDNCKAALHKTLSDIVRHDSSNLSLITIDYAYDEEVSGVGIVKMNLASDEVIRGIIKNAGSGLPDTDVDRIVRFSEGFPTIAVLMLDALNNQVANYASLSDKELMRKIIWGRDTPDPHGEEVIKVCSLFYKLGFSEIPIEGIPSEYKDIVKRFCSTTITDQSFVEQVKKFKARGLIEQEGRYIRVRPFPVALKLASDWWSITAYEKLKEALEGSSPDQLERLGRQFKFLSNVQSAIELVETILGDKSPFGNAEVLLTEQGSRLFRYLVEVNPEASIHTLEKVFLTLDSDDIPSKISHLYSLVDAIGKLCFWRDTFVRAALLLRKFVDLSEKRFFGGNDRFFELFHIHLPGTLADLSKRYEVIEYLINSNSQRDVEIGIAAIGSAFHLGHFSRMGGVERQGLGSPEMDYAPKSAEEINQYWKECYVLLSRFLNTDNKFYNLAKKQLLDNFRMQILNGSDSLVAMMVELTLEVDDSELRKKLHNEISEIISLDRVTNDETNLNRLSRFKAMLSPRTFKEKLDSIVNLPPYEHRKEDGRFVDVSAINAGDFAREVAQDYYKELLENVDSLFRGEQRAGWAFGESLARYIENPSELLDICFIQLLELQDQKLNISFLASFLKILSLSRKVLTTQFLQRIADQDSPIVRKNYIVLLASVKPTADDITKALLLLYDGKVDVEDFDSFSYGRSLDDLSYLNVNQLCDSLSRFNKKGILVALNIWVMYVYNDDLKFKQSKELIREFLLTNSTLSNPFLDASRSLYNSQSLYEKLFREENSKNEVLALHLTSEIIAMCTIQPHIGSYEYAIKPLIKMLFEKYFDTAWPAISEAMVFNKNASYNLSYLLTDDIHDSADKTIMFNIDEHYLLEWCAKYSDVAPKILARNIPIFYKDKEEIKVNQFVLKFTELYGEVEGVVSELSGNLGTFSWIGSLVPYFERQKGFFEILLKSKSEKVRKWALSNFAYTEKRLQEARLEDEEDLADRQRI